MRAILQGLGDLGRRRFWGRCLQDVQMSSRCRVFALMSEMTMIIFDSIWTVSDIQNVVLDRSGQRVFALRGFGAFNVSKFKKRAFLAS